MDQFSQGPFRDAITDDDAASRQAARDSLFLMADVHVAGEPDISQVRVRNLSAGGLMAEYPGGLTQGLDVRVEVRGLGKVSGKVAWAAAGRIGIAFDQPIDPKLARKPVGGGAKTPVFVKPILPRR